MFTMWLLNSKSGILNDWIRQKQGHEDRIGRSVQLPLGLEGADRSLPEATCIPLGHNLPMPPETAP